MTNSVDAIMRPRYVVVWPEDLSPEGKAILKTVSAKLNPDLGAYEDWPEIPSGADLYDYRSARDYQRAKNLPTFMGCCQTFSPKLEYPVKQLGKRPLRNSPRLQFCIDKDVSYDCYGSNRWCDAVARWQKDLPAKNRGFGVIPYSEFVLAYLATSKV